VPRARVLARSHRKSIGVQDDMLLFCGRLAKGTQTSLAESRTLVQEGDRQLSERGAGGASKWIAATYAAQPDWSRTTEAVAFLRGAMRVERRIHGSC